MNIRGILTRAVPGVGTVFATRLASCEACVVVGEFSDCMWHTADAAFEGWRRDT